jgi:transposase
MDVAKHTKYYQGGHMKDSKYYVGMDVHKAATVITVLNSAGKQIMKSIVETKANTILDVVKGLRGEIHLTFEEGTHSSWLYDLLKSQVYQLIVCNPRDEKLRSSGNKSDDIDSYKLAEMLRLGGLKAVYHGQEEMRKLQELTRSYQYLVEDCTRVKNRIKAIFRARAISYKGDSIYQASKRLDWLAQLKEEGVKNRAQYLYQELDCLLTLCEQSQKEMIAEARKHKAFKILDSIPTLGSIRVALILAAMLTPHRFGNKRQLWCYSGLAVVSSSSADYSIVNGQIKKSKKQVATRGLNHNFNRTLKMVFKTAATSVSKGILKDYYDALLAKGTSPQMARLTLARKLAAIVLSLWKKGESFNPDKFIMQTV